MKLELLNAFEHDLRVGFADSLAKAYRIALRDKFEFGSFGFRAHGYLKHFWSDAMLEQLAITRGLHHEISYNKAKNTPHLAMYSGDWKLTPHHISDKGSVPVKASYRNMYSAKNYDLFSDSQDDQIVKANQQGYVYLLHSGANELENLILGVPDTIAKGLVYQEPLSLKEKYEVDVEEIKDELSEGIKIKVEEVLRQSNQS